MVAFARGADSAGWYNEFAGQTPGVTAGWYSIGGQLTSGTATYSAPGELDVYALGTDNQPWTNSSTWPALHGWNQVRIDY